MSIWAFVLLILFLISSGVAGMITIRFFWEKAEGLFFVSASFVVGFLVSVWFLYIFASILSSTLWGIVAFDLAGVGLMLVLRKKVWFPSFTRLTRPEWSLLAGFIAASTWIAFKSFHAGPDGTLLIGSNEVFDFGHALSVVRSFSQGDNVPYSSPFIAGEPHIYHFLFYFWLGILERLGVPIVYAFNAPTIVAFVTLLSLIYETAVNLYKNVWVGIVAAYLSLTHSTLTFWYFFADPKNASHPFGALWRNASYYFAGPYDGSEISIFWTLNVFVNQRHLVFGLSAVLVLFYMLSRLLEEEAEVNIGKLILLGILTGFMLWWHTMFFVAAFFILVLLLAARKHYAGLLCFGASAVIVAMLEACPWIGQIGQTRDAHGQLPVFYWFLSSDMVSFLKYWVLNLGGALLTIPLGFFLLAKNKRTFVLPFIVLFFLSNFIRFGRDITENHKFINLVLIIGNILSAGAVFFLFQKKNILSKIIAGTLLILLSFSGVIDLMVIKNDFQYSVSDYGASQFMRWIRDETPRNAVLLSYQDIFDPVALAGRRTYIGFFGARMYPERLEFAREVFEATHTGSLAKLAQANISYLVIPKWKKDDFPYNVDIPYLRQNLSVSYEDERHVIFQSRPFLVE